MKYEKVIALMSSYVSFKPEDFEIMIQRCTAINLSKNEIWEKEGKIGKYLGFVNKGILRQYHVKDGQEYTQAFNAEQEYIGNYISYLTNMPATTSIQALEDCELLVMTFDDIQKLYDEVPSLDRFGRLYAEQLLIDLHAKTSNLLQDTPEERYYQLLKEKPDLHARVKQYYIAQYLGIRPESLSRIRKRHASIK